MKGIHKSEHQDYIVQIQKSFKCDFGTAVKIAICIGYKIKGYDLRNSEKLLATLNANGVDGNLWLFDEMYSTNPNLFPNIDQLLTNKKTSTF